MSHSVLQMWKLSFFGFCFLCFAFRPVLSCAATAHSEMPRVAGKGKCAECGDLRVTMDGEVAQPFARNEPTVAADGCRRRMLTCGGANVIDASIQINGETSFRDDDETPNTVTITLECNENAQWIFRHPDGLIVVTSAQCNAIIA